MRITLSCVKLGTQTLRGKIAYPRHMGLLPMHGTTLPHFYSSRQGRRILVWQINDELVEMLYVLKACLRVIKALFCFHLEPRFKDSDRRRNRNPNTACADSRKQRPPSPRRHIIRCCGSSILPSEVSTTEKKLL